MLKTLWNGRSGLAANQNRLDVISNNIANVNTNGYKKLDVSFSDLVYDKLNGSGNPITSRSRDGLVLGSGSRADIVTRDIRQGMPVKTDKEWDMAIEGPGFFRVIMGKDENGNEIYGYTRDGEFTMGNIEDQRGLHLIHSSGYELKIEGLNPEDFKSPVSVIENGQVYSQDKLVGTIKLYDFKDREGIIPVASNLFEGTGESEAAGSIKQGYLERSNVDITQELTDMMVTQRAFDLNSRSVKTADDMWQIANNLRGR